MQNNIHDKDISERNQTANALTLTACCMKSIAISKPNNSPATRVNRLMMEQAPKIAKIKSKIAVHTHTLRII